MKKFRRADTTIGDCAAIVGINTTQGKPVIVGGQAANVWANFYFSRIGARLSRFRPFTSKDLDLAGDRSLLEQIRDVTGGSIHYSGPRTPVIGYVETLIGETSRKIEVLRDVKGLQRWELADAVNLLEELREIVRSPEATKAATIWGLDFTSVWPINNLVEFRMQKIQRFVQHRLNPMG